MSDLLLLLVTGVGLGALYFLAASGLSLIYGLMGVLNFAHGVFMTAGAYAGWLTMRDLPQSLPVAARLAVALVVAVIVGGLIGVVVEVVLIRPLYRHHIQQVLVTVGLSLAGVAAAQGIWGADPRPVEKPTWMSGTTVILGARLPNDRFVYIAAALLLLAGLLALMRYTRLGLVIRAGVENRTMVEALGIDVQRTFTIVFAIGGDPVRQGLAASLNFPGVNATGITLLTTLREPKRLGLLSQLVPTAATVGFLVIPSFPPSAGQIRDAE